MKFDDLRQFIGCMRERGELLDVDGADWNLEIGAITHVSSFAPDPPSLLFNKVKGYPEGFRVLTYVRQNRTAGRLIYGIDEQLNDDEAVQAWRKRLRNYAAVPPMHVQSGPVTEHVLSGDAVNLETLPWVRWHEHDGGRYMCGTSVILRDPDSGYVNLGSYRFMLIDRDRMVVHIGSGHNGDVIRKKYWAQGESCPVAISLGQDPAIFIVAGTNLSWGTSEYDYIGWMRGGPVEVISGPHTGLPIPSSAEAVLEGEMLPPEAGMETEGPFGEASGYYGGGARPSSVIKIHAILHRNDPIVLGDPPLIADGHNVLYSRAVNILEELDGLGIPGIRGVNYEWGRTIISLQQSFPGHAMRAALGAMGGTAGYHGRIIIVVDEDINPHNLSEVFWAIATRCDPETSMDVCKGIWSYAIDPRLAPEKRSVADTTTSVVIINACRPFHWKDRFPATTKVSEEERRECEAKWGETLRTRP